MSTFRPATGNGALKAALFLDRDGVINVEKDYVHQIAEFEFMDGIFDLCRLAAARAMPIVVVTNQAGIGRGYYSEQQFHALSAWMRARFEAQSVRIDGVYFCPSHPEHGIGAYRCDSFDRKPNPGMILRAQGELGLDLARSVLIGDKDSDIMAARAAGIGRTVLLASQKQDGDGGADIVVKTLAEAAQRLFGPLGAA